MDLNMKIDKNTFSQLGVRAKERRIQRDKLPDKSVINLMQLGREREKHDTRVLLWILGAVIVLAAAFYGGVRPWMAMRDQERAADARETEYLAWQVKNADYAKIEERYDVYYGPYLTESEGALLDRADILDLMERVVMPAATITRLEIPESNSFSLRLSGISVQGMHDLLLRLGEEPLVAIATAPSLSTAEEMGTSESIEFDLYITVVDAQAAAEIAE